MRRTEQLRNGFRAAFTFAHECGARRWTANRGPPHLHKTQLTALSPPSQYRTKRQSSGHLAKEGICQLTHRASGATFKAACTCPRHQRRRWRFVAESSGQQFSGSVRVKTHAVRWANGDSFQESGFRGERRQSICLICGANRRPKSESHVLRGYLAAGLRGALAPLDVATASQW